MARRIKKRWREALEIEVDGKTYIGERVIEGSRRLDQYVIYQDQCLEDLNGYFPETKDNEMQVIAQQLLWELVVGRTISAKQKERYKL
jgi:hypothetical protein